MSARGAATAARARRPARARKRQARGDVTRDRILDAVIECVERGGFASATTHSIAHQAGLSVGALQHHFASKEAVLDAVLEQSAARFADCFEGVEPAKGKLATRVAGFVDRAWLHYGSAFFRGAQEIVLGARRGADERPAALLASARIADRVWNDWFGDLALGPAEHRDLRRHAFASLTGLALMARFEPDATRLERPLSHLKTGLHASIQTALRDSSV